MLQEIKTVFQKEFNYFLENARERSKQRNLQQAQQKTEEVQRQKALGKQHLLAVKRYFSASFLDFYIMSNGDVYELFPHRRYKMDNFVKGYALDVRTKVRGMDKAKQKKLETNLLADFIVLEKNF